MADNGVDTAKRMNYPRRAAPTPARRYNPTMGRGDTDRPHITIVVVGAVALALLPACSDATKAPTTPTVTVTNTQVTTVTQTQTVVATTTPQSTGANIVIYRLYSTVQKINVSWTSGGQLQSRPNAQMRDRTQDDDGWIAVIRTNPGPYYSITASTINDDTFAFMRCEVRVDGRLVIEDDSSGADANVDCRYKPQ